LVEQLVVYLSDLPSVDTQAAIEVNLALNVDQQSIQLEGWLTQFNGEGFLHYRVGQVRCQDAFNLWISHLSACSQGISRPSSFVGVNARKQEIEHLGFLPVSQSQAMSLIELLISFWWRGMHQPLPFSVDIAQLYYDELQKPTSDETSLRASLKSEIEQWLTDDEYAGRCWASVTETLLEDTIELIESVYIPMASRLVSFKDGSAKEEYKNLSVNGADNG
jgi:exonuclease V gamma subunit